MQGVSHLLCSSLQCSTTSQVVCHCARALIIVNPSASQRSISDSLQHYTASVSVHHQSSIRHNMQQKFRIFSHTCSHSFLKYLSTSLSTYLFFSIYLFVHMLLSCVYLNFEPTNIYSANSRNQFYLIFPLLFFIYLLFITYLFMFPCNYFDDSTEIIPFQVTFF